MQISPARCNAPVSGFQRANFTPASFAPQASDSFFSSTEQALQFGAGNRKPAPKTAYDALLTVFDAAKTGDLKTIKALLPKLKKLHQDGKIQFYDDQTPVNVTLNKQLPVSDVKPEYLNKTLMDVAVENKQGKVAEYLRQQGAGDPESSRYYQPPRDYSAIPWIKYTDSEDAAQDLVERKHNI